MAEIPDAELAQLRAAQELLVKLNGKPESRQLLERSIKQVMPEVETSDDVAERFQAPLREELKQVREEIAAQRTELAEERKAATQRQEEYDTVAAFKRIEAAGYTEDGIGKIKQLMVDRKIADPEAAAALFDRMNPPAANEQPGWSPATWSPESVAAPQTDVKMLFKDEERWADNEAARVLNEMRSTQG